MWRTEGAMLLIFVDVFLGGALKGVLQNFLLLFLSGNRIRKGKMVVFSCDVDSDKRGNADNYIFSHEGNLKEKKGLW